MNGVIERVRAMAREAIEQYGRETHAGGEPVYPDWADDMLAVCDLAAQPAASAEPKNAVTVSQLEMLFESEDVDRQQPGYHWRKGWNAAIRRCMDIAYPMYAAPVAAQAPQESDEPLPAPGIHAAVHYAGWLRREAHRHQEPKASVLRQTARMLDVLQAECARLHQELIDAQALQQDADPCPQCIPGGVCKTPTCGRLLAAQASGQAPAAAGDARDAARYRWLRDPCSGAERVIFYCRGDYGRGLMSGATLDAAIDAAMRKEGK